ncbi:MAG: DPP IV N-terminal domain-containing protein, partial [Bacteroidota bacterium]
MKSLTSMRKSLFSFVFLFGFGIQTSIAQNTSAKASAAVEEKTGLTLERVFRDPTLYPKPGNFGEFAPDGKHFIEFKLDDSPQPSDKITSPGPNPWQLIKKDIEGKSITPIILFDAKRFEEIPPQGSYEISGDEKFMVVQYEKQQVYRHSFTAKCYVVDLQSHKITYIPGRMRYPTLSPDNKRVAYVKEN